MFVDLNEVDLSLNGKKVAWGDLMGADVLPLFAYYIILNFLKALCIVF